MTNTPSQIWDSLDEIWLHYLNDIVENGHQTGSRDGATRERLFVSFCLGDPRNNFVFSPARGMRPWYAAAELLWYLSGTNKIEMIQRYAPQYARFTEDGATAFGAYGKRWKSDYGWQMGLFKGIHENKIKLQKNPFFWPEEVEIVNQLQGISCLLTDKKESRQGVVVMWNGGDLAHAIAGDKNDLPCTLALQFIIRENRLHMQTFMRSQDIWLGLPYDVWCFTGLQILLAEALGLELGHYSHSVTSLHLYDRNAEEATQALEETYKTDDLIYKPHVCPVAVAIKEALETEEYIRNGTAHVCPLSSIRSLGQDSFLGQCIAMIESKWGEPIRVANKVMRHYIERVRTDAHHRRLGQSRQNNDGETASSVGGEKSAES